MWAYQISTGRLSHNGEIIGSGYSGAPGVWKNNPALTHDVAKGPIPSGLYEIGAPFNSAHTGPFAMRLTPKDGTDTFNRADFEMHGDSVSHPGAASHGCICIARTIREAVWESGDHELEVVP